ncbi:MAG: outer membrane lipoprotein carrier protein LolA [Paracoccaceae bacterium]
MKRTLLALPLLLATAATPVLADEIPLSKLSAYINGLTTAQANFTQINPDGSGSKGLLIIKRPGRMRFEYTKPDKTVVLASGGQVAIFDAKSNQPPEQYPLSKTPLNLVLAPKVNLEQSGMVVGHSEEGKLTVVTAQDPKHPEVGTIELGFSNNPIALRQWIVTDETGGQTTVLLDELKTGETYAPSTFIIDDEIARRKKN